MLKNEDFVVFSDDFGRHPFSCQHIMERFLPHNRLLWVHTIGLRRPELTWYDLKRSVEKIRSWMRPEAGEPNEPLPDNLRIVSPVMIPYAGIGAVRAFNRASVVKTVRKAMRGWCMRRPIVLATLPNAADYLGLLDERLAVYYCVDDFALWPGMNQPELVKKLENALLERVHLAAVTSKSLLAARRCKNGPTRLLTHGVDVGHFSSPPGQRPAALSGMRKPVIGCYGLFDGRVDMSLIKDILVRRPQWQVLFIGNAVTSLEPLSAFANFLHIPAVPYSELPAYAACFDVAIIPYLVNEQTVGINPLKLREYIATGKPVVSAPLPAALELAGSIRIARSGPDYVEAIEEALADTATPEERRAVLAGHSWEDKAELLSAWIAERLGSGTAI